LVLLKHRNFHPCWGRRWDQLQERGEGDTPVKLRKVGCGGGATLRPAVSDRNHPPVREGTLSRRATSILPEPQIVKKPLPQRKFSSKPEHMPLVCETLAQEAFLRNPTKKQLGRGTRDKRLMPAFLLGLSITSQRG